MKQNEEQMDSGRQASNRLHLLALYKLVLKCDYSIIDVSHNKTHNFWLIHLKNKYSDHTDCVLLSG